MYSNCEYKLRQRYCDAFSIPVKNMQLVSKVILVLND